VVKVKVNLSLPLYTQGNRPWYPLGRRLGGSQSLSGGGGGDKISQPLPGLKPPITQPELIWHRTGASSGNEI